MGSEIFIPIFIAGKWGLLAAGCLGLIYAALFPLRNSSAICRAVLQAILYVFGGMLSAASVVFILMIVASLFVILVAKIDPPSDRLVMLGFAVGLSVTMALAWWGQIALFRHYKRSLQT
jgi:hypothetical protein